MSQRSKRAPPPILHEGDLIVFDHSEATEASSGVRVGLRVYYREDQSVEVYEALNPTTGAKCGALRCAIRMDDIASYNKQRIYQEALAVRIGLTARKLNLSRIAHYIGAITHHPSFKFVVLMPLYPLNLLSLMPSEIGPERLKQILFSVLVAVREVEQIAPSSLVPIPRYEHVIPENRQLVLGDIKGSNVLVDPETGRLILNDFNSAHFVDKTSTSTKITYVAATSGHAPPEFEKARLSGPYVDVYSAAILVVQIWKGGATPEARDLAAFLSQFQITMPRLATFVNKVLMDVSTEMRVGMCLQDPLFENMEMCRNDQSIKEWIQSSLPKIFSIKTMAPAHTHPPGALHSPPFYRDQLRLEIASHVGFNAPGKNKKRKIYDGEPNLQSAQIDKEVATTDGPPPLSIQPNISADTLGQLLTVMVVNLIHQAQGRHRSEVCKSLFASADNREAFGVALQHFLLRWIDDIGSAVRFNELLQRLWKVSSGPAPSIAEAEITDFKTTPAPFFDGLQIIMAKYFEMGSAWPTTLLGLKEINLLTPRTPKRKFLVKCLVASEIIILPAQKSSDGKDSSD